ncbi:polysaccharide pyruvyl transferase family protein [Mesorhizobium sp. LHD-90]|uniref:polysaccharide pyruvyl transferase family protein n=1 Tax=Mesorhizobium sp. LHD-90 TaxID=3071414 RepID=UPI0027E04F60|nr:polysaccharide pyruvyl transferase family protein [Mesorhizobium sp. LHD-90]MDQ6437384.1 polysaccharide pyruvyl transferase family protein [Mesorhizobium sp. LHD-90]
MTRSGERRVLITGMFDMQNYGDLLFPLVARQRLAPHGIEIVPVAPTGRSPDLADAIAPISATRMLSGEEEFDAVLIGGGYLIHNHPMTFLTEYINDEVSDWASAALWLGATLAAALADVPVLWNAPGVPHLLGRGVHPLAMSAVRAASYLSLRDRGAAELLSPPPDLPLAIVPDTVAGIGALWSRQQLEAAFRGFLERKDADRTARYMTLHLRDRSVAGLDMAVLAAKIDAFAKLNGLTPLLVAVGRNHDDPKTASRLAEHLKQPHVLLDDPLSLCEMTAVFAHSVLYVGASLHGYVACVAHRVPSVLVARPAYRKFAGFLEHTGRSEDMARDWDAALDKAAAKPVGAAPPISAEVLARLDEHWTRILDGINEPGRGAGARRDFLRDVLRMGLDNRGPSWALAPFLSPSGTKSLRRDETA